MKSPEEYRQALLAEIKRAYRLIRRYERLLESKPLARVYKNPKCKSALKMAERREEIEDELKEVFGSLNEAWAKLPEIDGKIDQDAAYAFAAKLCKPKRNPRFLKNQRLLIDP